MGNAKLELIQFKRVADGPQAARPQARGKAISTSWRH